MHLTQLLTLPPTLNEVILAEKTIEVASVYERDGRAYSGRLFEICRRLSSHEHARGKETAGLSGTHLVAENIVQQILMHMERGEISH